MPKKPQRGSGKAPTLTDKQSEGIKYEVAHPNASLRDVARAAGVTHQAVALWRKNSDYVVAKQKLQKDKAVDSYLRKRAKEDDARARKIRDEARKRIGNPDTTLELLYWELGGKNNWSGSVVSPFDGQTYTDLEAYIEHLKNWRSADAGRVAWVGHRPRKPVKQ